MPEPFLPPDGAEHEAGDEAALDLLPPDLQAFEDAVLPRLRALAVVPAPEVERRLLLVARAQAEGIRRQGQARRLASGTRRVTTLLVRPLAAAAVVLVAALLAGRNAPHPQELAARPGAAVLGYRPAARVLSAEGALGRDNQEKRVGSTVAPDEPLAVRPGGHLLLELPGGTKLGLDGGSRGRLRFDPRTRRLELHEGRLWADVVPIAQGPDRRPILVDTPSGRARVIGTELTLRATAARTLVGVRHGCVRLEGARGTTLVETSETGLLAEGFPPEARRTGAIERQFRWIGKLQPRAAHPCERPTGGGPIGEDEAALGKLTVRLSDGRQMPLRLSAQTFAADVVDGVVHVTATCTFENHTSQALEGTFSLQLPQQASIARYAVTIDGQVVEGTVVERERARAIYEEAKRRMDDPGLLEWAQGNLFTAKVTPIAPLAPKTITVGWVEELPERDGVMRLLLPLVSGTSQETPPDRLGIEVRLRGELLRAPFRCPSHFLRARQEPDARVLSLDAEGLRPRNDFVLELYRGGAPTVEAALEPGQDFAPATALVRLRPQLGNLLEEELPQRVAVVLDASRSQSGTLKEVQLELLEALLQALPPRARPRVFLLHVGLEELTPPPAVAPGEGLLAAVWRNEPQGGADYGRGFTQLGRALPPDWGGVLVLVGDGLPSCGEREPSALAATFARALPAEQVRRVITVGLGSAVDEPFLARLARERAGVHVGLRPGDDLSRKLDEVLGALTRPVLSQVQVQLELDGAAAGAARELSPRRPQSVRAGEALTLLARVPGDARSGRVVLSGVVNGRSFRLRAPFSFRRAPAAAGLDGLWARKRVQDLLEDGPAQKPAVLALALDHGIVTPYTSLLVLPEDKRASYEVEAQARRRERRIGELLAEGRRLLAAHEDQRAAEAIEQLMRLAGERPDVNALAGELALRLGPVEPEVTTPAYRAGGEQLTLSPLQPSPELALAEAGGPAGTFDLWSNGPAGVAREEGEDVYRWNSQTPRKELNARVEQLRGSLREELDRGEGGEGLRELRALEQERAARDPRPVVRDLQTRLEGLKREKDAERELEREEGRSDDIDRAAERRIAATEALDERLKSLRETPPTDEPPSPKSPPKSPESSKDLKKQGSRNAMEPEVLDKLRQRPQAATGTTSEEVGEPIVVLEGDVELTRDIPKGTDLSALGRHRSEQEKRPAGSKADRGDRDGEKLGELHGSGAAGAYGDAKRSFPPAPTPTPRPEPKPAEALPLAAPERKPTTRSAQGRAGGAAPPEPSQPGATDGKERAGKAGADKTAAYGFAPQADPSANEDRLEVRDREANGLIDPPSLQVQSGAEESSGSVLSHAESGPVVVGGLFAGEERARGDDSGGMTQLDPPNLAPPGTTGGYKVRDVEVNQTGVIPLEDPNLGYFARAVELDPNTGQTRGGRQVAEGQVARLSALTTTAEDDLGALRDGLTEVRARLIAEGGLELATVELRGLPQGELFRETDKANDDRFDYAELAGLNAETVAEYSLARDGRGAFQRLVREQLARFQAALPEQRPVLFDALRARCLNELEQDAALQGWLAAELIPYAADDLDLLAARARALLSEGRTVAAWRAFSALVEARPDDADAHARYARGLLALGLVGRALDELAEAARLAPGEPARVLTLARTAVRCGDLPRAERAYLALLGQADAALAATARGELDGVYAALAARRPGQRDAFEARRALLRGGR